MVASIEGQAAYVESDACKYAAFHKGKAGFLLIETEVIEAAELRFLTKMLQ